MQAKNDFNDYVDRLDWERAELKKLHSKFSDKNQLYYSFTNEHGLN